MANNPIGDSFFEGELGVVSLELDGVYLGKTVDAADIEFVEDIKDIYFAQDGTQPADKIPTGQGYQITCQLGQITLDRISKIIRGVTVVNDSAKFGVDLYRSAKTNFAKPLVITRTDSDGVASTDKLYRMYCYKAFPMASGPIGSFGPDAQRVFNVTFYLFRDDTTGLFFYTGYSSSLSI